MICNTHCSSSILRLENAGSSRWSYAVEFHRHTYTYTNTHTQAHANRYTYIKPFDNVVHVKMVWKHVFIKTISIWRYLYRSFVIYWLWGEGGDGICILIIVRGLYYGTGTSIVTLLAERIWGKSLHILI